MPLAGSLSTAEFGMLTTAVSILTSMLKLTLISYIITRGAKPAAMPPPLLRMVFMLKEAVTSTLGQHRLPCFELILNLSAIKQVKLESKAPRKTRGREAKIPPFCFNM